MAYGQAAARFGAYVVAYVDSGSGDMQAPVPGDAIFTDENGEVYESGAWAVEAEELAIRLDREPLLKGMPRRYWGERAHDAVQCLWLM